MTVRTIEQPSCFRNRHNTGAADIIRGKILTPSTTEVDGCALATSATASSCGVSVETMQGTTNGVITKSVQISGVAAVIPGAQIAIGDQLTSDSTGRAIPVTLTSQTVIGTARTAASAAVTTFSLETAVEVELGEQSQVSASGAMRCLDMTVAAADFSAAATSQSFSMGTIPSGSWIVGYQVIPVALLVEGVQTYTTALDIGYSGVAEYIAANLNVGYGGTITTPLEAAVSKACTADRAIVANFAIQTGNVGDGSASLYTAGSTRIRVFYFTPTVVTVDPTP